MHEGTIRIQRKTGCRRNKWVPLEGTKPTLSTNQKIRHCTESNFVISEWRNLKSVLPTTTVINRCSNQKATTIATYSLSQRQHDITGTHDLQLSVNYNRNRAAQVELANSNGYRSCPYNHAYGRSYNGHDWCLGQYLWHPLVFNATGVPPTWSFLGGSLDSNTYHPSK